MPPFLALVDAGPLIAYYNKTDSHHNQICDYFAQCTYQLVTTEPCIAEVMYAIGKSSHQVQISLAQDIADGIWQREPLENSDFKRIAELFEKYKNVPADFADLSLVVISERLNIPQIVSLDSDFNIYRRLRDKPQPFNRIFYPHTQSKNKR